MNDRTLNDILKNPVYNGWVLRKGERSPAAWRDSPPVDDALWARIQGLLAARTRGGGPRRIDTPDPLRGLVHCVCGSTIRASGFTYGSRRREIAAAIAESLAKPDAMVVPIERGQLDHRRRQLALDVAAGRIGERAFLAAIRRLSEEEARVVKPSPSRRTVDAAKAMDYIRNFAASWAKAKPPTRATMSSRSTRRSSFGVRSLSACG
jgi:hypothetical protein